MSILAMGAAHTGKTSAQWERRFQRNSVSVLHRSNPADACGRGNVPGLGGKAKNAQNAPLLDAHSTAPFPVSEDGPLLARASTGTSRTSSRLPVHPLRPGPTRLRGQVTYTIFRGSAARLLAAPDVTLPMSSAGRHLAPGLLRRTDRMPPMRSTATDPGSRRGAGSNAPRPSKCQIFRL